jgi:ABC-2 type transport system permease protein
MNLVMDWWTAVAGMIIEQGTAIAFLGIIFYRINKIKGWDLYEMIFLLSLFVLSRPIYRIFFQGAHQISKMVLDGTLDQILIRPRNPLTIILTCSTNPVASGDFLLGTIFLLYSIPHLSITWNLWRVFYMAVIVISGSLVYAGTFLLKGIFCIFVVKLDAMNTLLQQFREYAKYPINIYHPIIKIMLISLLPYGLVSSVPAAIFLGKDGIHWIAWMAPVLCLFYLLLTGSLFHWSLRFYKSSGS